MAGPYFYPPLGTHEAPAIVCAAAFLSFAFFSIYLGTWTRFPAHYLMGVSGLGERRGVW